MARIKKTQRPYLEQANRHIRKFCELNKVNLDTVSGLVKTLQQDILLATSSTPDHKEMFRDLFNKLNGKALNIPDRFKVGSYSGILFISGVGYTKESPDILCISGILYTFPTDRTAPSVLRKVFHFRMDSSVVRDNAFRTTANGYYEVFPIASTTVYKKYKKEALDELNCLNQALKDA